MDSNHLHESPLGHLANGSMKPSTQSILVRPASPSDAGAIQKIGSGVFADTFGHSLSAADLEAYLDDAYSPAAVAADLVDPLKDTYVACDAREGSVLGFAMLTEGTLEDCVRDAVGPIELQRLYVDRSAHGRGIGKALVERVEDVARRRGFGTMWLGVWEENYTAQKVYAKLGYMKVGQHDFRMGECVQTDWILTKVL